MGHILGAGNTPNAPPPPPPPPAPATIANSTVAQAGAAQRAAMAAAAGGGFDNTVANVGGSQGVSAAATPTSKPTLGA